MTVEEINQEKELINSNDGKFVYLLDLGDYDSAKRYGIEIGISTEIIDRHIDDFDNFIKKKKRR